MASWEDRFIRILEKDEWTVDYDKENKKYGVSYFEEFHFCDEIWFDAYEDKEVDDKINKIVEKLECNKVSFKNLLSRGRIKLTLDAKGMEYYLNLLIGWIKELK